MDFNTKGVEKVAWEPAGWHILTIVEITCFGYLSECITGNINININRQDEAKEWRGAHQAPDICVVLQCAACWGF